VEAQGPRHKYRMKQNVQRKDGKGQLGEEGDPEP
jgi:hypothetical protein